MGYSPGEFNCKHTAAWSIHDRDWVEEKIHWELKDGPRIVLWTNEEEYKIIELTADEAIQCLNQLRTCIVIATGEDPV